MLEDKVGYKKLIVWEKADDLAFRIYTLTKKFPKEEMYGLISQLRRAALSIPVNIAEGHARQNKNEFRQFVNIALGSLAEVRYLLEFSLKLGYLDEKLFYELADLGAENGRLLWKFYKSI